MALMVAPAGWPPGARRLTGGGDAPAPLGEALGAPTLFSPMTFFQPLLPGFRAAGPLALVGGLVLTLGLVWHDRRRTTGWWGAPVAFVLVLGAPFLVSRIGRGIQVPAEGVSAPLWLIWQVAVFAAAAALLVVAASLLPAPKGKGRIWTAVAGAAVGVVAAVVGALIWNARHGWPDWYPVLWSIALGLVIWPGRRRAMLAGLAVATGAAAALMTWGAEVESRVAAARADLATLGDRADPIAVPLLDEFIDQAEVGAVPRTASELFALWRAAPLSRQGFPAALALWGPDGSPLAALRLDEVDLPDSLVARQVIELAPEQERRIEALQRIPSVHYLAVVRLDPTTVLSIGLGPRSSLVSRARLGRLLEPTGRERPLYRLSLAPTFSLRPPQDGVALFRREGWTARGERTVAMGDGARDVFAVVELGSAFGLLVRGALLVVLDAALLFGLGLVASWLWHGVIERPAWLPERRVQAGSPGPGALLRGTRRGLRAGQHPRDRAGRAVASRPDDPADPPRRGARPTCPGSGKAYPTTGCSRSWPSGWTQIWCSAGRAAPGLERLRHRGLRRDRSAGRPARRVPSDRDPRRAERGGRGSVGGAADPSPGSERCSC
ncbi:MAG: hypothetical protein R2909_20605 [Gemmatimonadales bacterium]